MGQKVNSISLRLEKTNRHFDSCWYDDYNYTDLLCRDYKIKNYFQSVYSQIKYPEGRILIENLPKKSNINLFYCNPSNSQRKKKILFQLQEKKSHTSKRYKKKYNTEIHRLFFKNSHTYILEDRKRNLYKKEYNTETEKSTFFTLAQQTLEGWKNWIEYNYELYTHKENNVQSDGKKYEKGSEKQIRVLCEETPVLHKNRLFYCLSDHFIRKKIEEQIYTEKELPTSGFCKETRVVHKQRQYAVHRKKKNITDEKVCKFLENEKICKFLLFQENKKTKYYSKIKEIITQKSYPELILCFSFKAQGLYSPIKDKEKCVFFYPLPAVPLHAQPIQPNANKLFYKSPIYTQEEGLNIKKKNTLSYEKGHRKLYTFLCGKNNIKNSLYEFVYNNKRKYSENKNKENTSVKFYNLLQSKKFQKSTVSKVFKIVDLYGNIDTGKKWVVERFFVRYLLARLYGEFLQNKSVYSQENLRFLYIFRIFFQEKKEMSIKDRISKKPISKKLGNYGFFYEQPCIEQNREKTSGLEGKRDTSLYNGLYSVKFIYKSHLESFLSKEYNSFFNLHLFRTLTEMQSALFLVTEIIYYLERKIPFRRIQKIILKEIPRYKHIKGVRMSCSGRVGGRSKKAQRSKTQSVKIGTTPLGVFSSQIDFASKSAISRFGLIGVKVWVCYR